MLGQKKIYREKQKFTPTWASLILTCLGLYLIYKTILQLFFDKPMGEHPMSDPGIVIFTTIMLVVFYLFGIFSLNLTVGEKKIEINFYPINKKVIPFEKIEKIELIDYKMFTSGIRISLKYGTVYRVRGKFGVFIELKNGEKVLVGTQRQKEIKHVVKHIKKEIL